MSEKIPSDTLIANQFFPDLVKVFPVKEVWKSTDGELANVNTQGRNLFSKEDNTDIVHDIAAYLANKDTGTVYSFFQG